MKVTSLACRAVVASMIASSLPGANRLVSAERNLNAASCSRLVDASDGSGNLLSLTLSRGGNDDTSVQESSSTYHEHGTFASTVEWYEDVCGDYSISCSHHECRLGLYFVPCKDNDAETTDEGANNNFSNHGFTTLQLQGTTELAFQGATTGLLECVENCDASSNIPNGVGLDQEFMEGFQLQNFDNSVQTLQASTKAPKAAKGAGGTKAPKGGTKAPKAAKGAGGTKAPKASKGAAPPTPAPTPPAAMTRRLDQIRNIPSEYELLLHNQEEKQHRNLKSPVYRLKHGIGFFSVIGGTGCYASVRNGQAQGNFGVDGGNMNIFVPYLRGFATSILSEGLQDSAFATSGGAEPAPKLPASPTFNIDNKKNDNKKASVPAVKSLSSIDWDVSIVAGIGNPKSHGWAVAQNGLELEFKVEDSYICPGGENSAEQKGIAKATVNLSEAQALMYTLSGQGEQLDTGFEMMMFKIDGIIVATATSTAAGKECSSGPLTVNYNAVPPYSLSAGSHELEVTFTTADGFDHVDSFYKLELSLA